MSKKKATELKLRNALDRLLAGESKNTDGRVIQENIALEAGVSRATFNRYADVVEEYRLVKTRKNSDAPPVPFTIDEKNRELQESNVALRKALTAERREFEKRDTAARQEIFVLNSALKARDKIIAAKDREIAQLMRHLRNAEQNNASHLHLVTGDQG